MRIRQRAHHQWITAAFSILASGTLAVAIDHFAIIRWTIDGGGVMRSTGGDFDVSGTIGQPDARVMSGGNFELTGGFWFALAPSDCNEDGSVDLTDYDDFESCLSGPDTATPNGCGCFDVNLSHTVDLLDLAVAQTAFTGS